MPFGAVESIRGGANARVVEEDEIDSGLAEALNSVEWRTAIETGQGQENVKASGQISQKSITRLRYSRSRCLRP